MIFGTLLSPYIFDAVDYYGCYSLAATMNAIVLGYFIWCVKEVPRPKHKNCEVCHQFHRSNKTCKGLFSSAEKDNNQAWTVVRKTLNADSGATANAATNKVRIQLQVLGPYNNFQTKAITKTYI